MEGISAIQAMAQAGDFPVFEYLDTQDRAFPKWSTTVSATSLAVSSIVAIDRLCGKQDCAQMARWQLVSNSPAIRSITIFEDRQGVVVVAGSRCNRQVAPGTAHHGLGGAVFMLAVTSWIRSCEPLSDIARA